jgi:nitroreductase
VSTLGLTAVQLDRVLGAAGRAPSLHNSQPWSFRPMAQSIEVHLDRDRVLPVSDPDSREARIACGAALFNLRLALMACGVEPAVTLLPRGASGPLAVVESAGVTVISREMAELERAVAQRGTNRRPFLTAEVPDGHRYALARAAEAEGGVIDFIQDGAGLGQVRELTVLAHRTQLANPAFVAEWDAWTRRVGSDDGVPLFAAGPAPAAQDLFTVRDFGSPDRPERIHGKDFEQDPLICVLSTHADAPLNQIQAGQAMERLLLAATVLGMSASFLSQLIEVPQTMKRLRTLVGGYRHPQVVLRVGFAGPTAATPRRPVRETSMGPVAE